MANCKVMQPDRRDLLVQKKREDFYTTAMDCEGEFTPQGLQAAGASAALPVAECRVRPLRVVFHPPFLDHDLYLLQ